MTIKPPPQTETHLSSRKGEPLGTPGRVLLAVSSLLMIAGFGLALSLNPSPTGRGTHQQLGLPPCTILLTFQIPCPTCGMTTSFSHFVRGQWLQSIQANASGFVLALGCVCYLPWAGISLFRKELWLMRDFERVLLVVVLSWVGLVLLEWSWRTWLS